jgi:hypothetical protein
MSAWLYTPYNSVDPDLALLDKNSSLAAEPTPLDLMRLKKQTTKAHIPNS